MEEELKKKIAMLETINDQLLTELNSIDQIARKLGFNNGINTLKSAALELLAEEGEEEKEDDEPPSFDKFI